MSVSSLKQFRFSILPLLELTQWVVKGFFTCQHRNIPVHEGKCYCPNCGKGVIFEWVVLECSGCHKRRKSHHLFNRLVPAHRCCLDCGHDETNTIKLGNPWYYQLKHAQIIFQDEEIYLENSVSTNWAEAWVDPVIPIIRGLLPIQTT